MFEHIFEQQKCYSELYTLEITNFLPFDANQQNVIIKLSLLKIFHKTTGTLKNQSLHLNIVARTNSFSSSFKKLQHNNFLDYAALRRFQSR